MNCVADKFADFVSDPPALNMTDKDLRLESSDLSALDSNFIIDSYPMKFATNV